ncbi:MAG: hypothetical protein JF616_10625 [Fibrobacteres bacterium]|nr:hypothetical protein [Fibrobacterota bacterium]
MPIVLGVSSMCAAVWAAGTSGDLYFTTYKGGADVNKISFNYDGTKLVVGAVVNVAKTDGSDGLIFAPDSELLVGGQGDKVHKINIATQAVVTHTAGGVEAYHMALDPGQQYAWASGIPGGLAKIPLAPFADGTAIPLTGDDTKVTSLAFQDASHAFYTSSGTDGVGNFGTLDLQTFTTHRLIKNLQGGHGMAFDSYTGQLMLFGGENIVQINPANGLIVSTRTFAGASFDQGTVDGKGHLFVADGNGTMLFVDYLASKKIGDTTNYVAQPFVAANMDDVAPLSGLGSNPNPNPNPQPDSLIAVAKALYQDADGNGRIDQVWVEFPKAIGSLPTQIQLQDPFNPSSTVTVLAADIARIDGTHILATFKDKEFAAGTGFDPKPYGKILADGKVFDGASFVIGDGVGPRIASAVSVPPANASDKPTLTVTFSEAVKADLAGGFPFDIKRPGASDPSGKIKVVSVQSTGGNTYVYTFDGSVFPLPGDSLRIKSGAAGVADAQGNPSNMKDYVPVGGVLPKAVYELETKGSGLVTVPKLDGPISLPNSILIIDQSVTPGVCLNCPPSVNVVFSDAVNANSKNTKPYLISLKVNAPFHYDLSFFDNLGVYVNKAIGDVSAADLARLRKDKDGNYLLSLAWWPVSARGGQVGNGAYIAHGTLTTTGDLKTIQGSQGEFRALTNKSENLFFTFGYLRR